MTTPGAPILKRRMSGQPEGCRRFDGYAVMTKVAARRSLYITLKV